MSRFFFVVFFLLLSGCQPAAEVSVSDARVRAMLPGMDKTAGYMNIVNRTGQTKVLLAITMPGVRAIEIHETVDVNGMVRMRRIEQLQVPAGGEVRLEPGGKHLMLFGVEVVPEQVPATLQWQDGEETPVVFSRLSN